MGTKGPLEKLEPDNTRLDLQSLVQALADASQTTASNPVCVWGFFFP